MITRRNLRSVIIISGAFCAIFYLLFFRSQTKRDDDVAGTEVSQSNGAAIRSNQDENQTDHTPDMPPIPLPEGYDSKFCIVLDNAEVNSDGTLVMKHPRLGEISSFPADIGASACFMSSADLERINTFIVSRQMVGDGSVDLLIPPAGMVLIRYGESKLPVSRQIEVSAILIDTAESDQLDPTTLSRESSATGNKTAED